jgi:DNA-binding NarL/FixJ family response regulator
MRESNRNVSVLLADDAAIVRNAVALLLKAEPAITILGEAANFRQAISMAMALKPDIILLDLHMPDAHAFEPAFIKTQLLLSGAQVLGMSLSSGEDDAVARNRADSLGAVLLLDKAEFGRQLIPAIMRLHASQ